MERAASAGRAPAPPQSATRRALRARRCRLVQLALYRFRISRSSRASVAPRAPTTAPSPRRSRKGWGRPRDAALGAPAQIWEIAFDGPFEPAGHSPPLIAPTTGFLPITMASVASLIASTKRGNRPLSRGGRARPFVARAQRAPRTHERDHAGALVRVGVVEGALDVLDQDGALRRLQDACRELGNRRQWLRGSARRRADDVTTQAAASASSSWGKASARPCCTAQWRSRSSSVTVSRVRVPRPHAASALARAIMKSGQARGCPRV